MNLPEGSSAQVIRSGAVEVRADARTLMRLIHWFRSAGPKALLQGMTHAPNYRESAIVAFGSRVMEKISGKLS